MGKVSILSEIISRLEDIDSNLTIYAAKPWTETSKAILLVEEEIERDQALIDQYKLEYFLEVFIAKDFLADWTLNQFNMPTSYQKCSRLIDYAINDA